MQFNYICIYISILQPPSISLLLPPSDILFLRGRQRNGTVDFPGVASAHRHQLYSGGSHARLPFHNAKRYGRRHEDDRWIRSDKQCFAYHCGHVAHQKPYFSCALNEIINSEALRSHSKRHTKPFYCSRLRYRHSHLKPFPISVSIPMKISELQPPLCTSMADALLHDRDAERCTATALSRSHQYEGCYLYVRNIKKEQTSII
ncbi:hypothetical protein EVAR_345_1 [Eumeta japonica]|uniref:Uncharacterized protein n=1 Tax=Eumeta variegata TaxID=151549 RepID=A0A4C1SAS6_EUMVA|nr:hypothetical protein EVAR_345_1 [Eumeta japonica]